MARIAYLNTDPGIPCFGRKGASIHIQQVCRCLVEMGHEITLFTRRIGGERPEYLSQIELVKLPKLNGKGDEREIEAIVANAEVASLLLAQGSYDLLYERYSLWSSASLEAFSSLGIPSILEVNAPLIEEQMKYRFLDRVDEAKEISLCAFESATSIVAVSEGVGNYLRSFSSGLADKIHVISNGVRTDLFTTKDWARDDNSVAIGFVGSLKPWHGVETLLRAFAKLSKSNESVTLQILGDGPERENLEVLSQTLGIRDRCDFIGAVQFEKIPGYLSALDIGVAPYPDLNEFYFSPLKVFEYMSAGLAIVASRIGQIEQVLDNDSGVMVKPGSVEELHLALSELAESKETRDRLGGNARVLAVKNHDWRPTVEKIISTVEVSNIRPRIVEGSYV